MCPQEAMSMFHVVAQQYLFHLFALNTLGEALFHGGGALT